MEVIMQLFKFYVTRDQFQDYKDGISYHLGATYMEGIVSAENEEDAKAQVSGSSHMKWDLSKDENCFVLVGITAEGVGRGFVVVNQGKTGRVWAKNRKIA